MNIFLQVERHDQHCTNIDSNQNQTNVETQGATGTSIDNMQAAKFRS